ncbi:hypothetical protein SADO_11314 [Salinisphaera dokdonensis CL-ES53]|uniref:Uncharacterized protein n=1 Tax=Salinisphaera dokdonensis CL-ES53 TaxID=1304272 RepID=A0ABV2B363_9GAMM
MDMSSSTIKRGLALCGVMAIGLSVSTISSARDRDDLITTASTAGTTAYIVGKNIDDDDFAQAHDFADSQSVALRREAATGGGENLDSLAALLNEENPDAFGRWMQSNYSELYGPETTEDSNVVDRIVAMR